MGRLGGDEIFCMSAEYKSCVNNKNRCPTWWSAIGLKYRLEFTNNQTTNEIQNDDDTRLLVFVFFRIKHLWVYAVLLLLVVGGLLVVQKIQTSAFQAQYFSKLSSKANFTVAAGASYAISFPPSVPYDDRLGYSKIPGFVGKLKSRDFEITHQARISEGMA